MHKSKTSSSKAKYPEQMAVPPETTGSKKQNSLQKIQEQLHAFRAF